MDQKIRYGERCVFFLKSALHDRCWSAVHVTPFTAPRGSNAVSLISWEGSARGASHKRCHKDG